MRVVEHAIKKCNKSGIREKSSAWEKKTDGIENEGENSVLGMPTAGIVRYLGVCPSTIARR